MAGWWPPATGGGLTASWVRTCSSVPYFRDALSSGTGRLFGIGTTRGEPGYYLASALLDGNRTVGVAVTKVSLDQLEQSWSTVEAPVIVTDENGVVIRAPVPDWKFTALRPLDENTRRRLTKPCSTTAALSPLGIKVLSDLDQGARVVRVAREGTGWHRCTRSLAGFLTQARALPGTPWTITVFSHMARGPTRRPRVAPDCQHGRGLLGAAWFHAQPAAPPPARSRA